ncbi:unnamed protein product, partial [Pylaiella littoralis]
MAWLRLLRSGGGGGGGGRCVILLSGIVLRTILRSSSRLLCSAALLMHEDTARSRLSFLNSSKHRWLCVVSRHKVKRPRFDSIRFDWTGPDWIDFEGFHRPIRSASRA